MKWLVFACKNVLRNRRRSLITVLIAAVGTAGVLVGGGFALFTYESLREMAARENGHLTLLASRIGTSCHVVFVTAYDQYAVQAFENAAVDYLLKPVSPERLKKTVARLKSQLSSAPPDLLPLIAKLSEQIRPQRQYLQWLQVSSHNDIELIPVDEVEFFQASDKYTLVVTRKTERVMRKSLKELEEELDPERFWRVHRNAIVRVAAIARVSRDFRGHLVLHLHQDGRTVAVGRNYSHLFRQM